MEFDQLLRTGNFQRILYAHAGGSVRILRSVCAYAASKRVELGIVCPRISSEIFSVCAEYACTPSVVESTDLVQSLDQSQEVDLLIMDAQIGWHAIEECLAHCEKKTLRSNRVFTSSILVIGADPTNDDLSIHTQQFIDKSLIFTDVHLLLLDDAVAGFLSTYDHARINDAALKQLATSPGMLKKLRVLEHEKQELKSQFEEKAQLLKEEKHLLTTCITSQKQSLKESEATCNELKRAAEQSESARQSTEATCNELKRAAEQSESARKAAVETKQTCIRVLSDEMLKLHQELQVTQKKLRNAHSRIRHIYGTKSWRWTAWLRTVEPWLSYPRSSANRIVYGFFGLLKHGWHILGEPCPKQIRWVRHSLLGRWKPRVHLAADQSEPANPPATESEATIPVNQKEGSMHNMPHSTPKNVNSSVTQKPVPSIKKHPAPSTLKNMALFIRGKDAPNLQSLLQIIERLSPAPAVIYALMDEWSEDTTRIINTQKPSVRILCGNWGNEKEAFIAASQRTFEPIMFLLKAHDEIHTNILHEGARFMERHFDCKAARFNHDSASFEPLHPSDDITRTPILIRRDFLRSLKKSHPYMTIPGDNEPVSYPIPPHDNES